LLQDMRNQRNENGGVLGGFEAWLLLRGMRTLYARVKTSSETAMKIAEVLIQNPAVSEVLYPGLPSHPNHDIAARQMTGGYGGMLSFRLMGGELAARRVAANVQIFRQAISFGSTESVIEHRADVEKSGSPTPRDLLRVSVGLEHPEDLIKDLTNALAIADSADFEAQIVAV
jgi:cystathionine gamma-synthase